MRKDATEGYTVTVVCNQGDKIVPLAGPREKMDFAAISEVRAYWEALRNGRPAPFRAEIDPRGIEQALEYAFILERVAPQVARFRLAGMHLNDLMGMEVRGMPITTFVAPSSRAKVAAIMERVFSAPETAEISLAAEVGFGRPAIEGRLLLLPLRSDLGDVTRALGCLVSHGGIGRTPRRFEMTSARTSAIAAKILEGEIPVPATGFAEPAVSFSAAPPRKVGGRTHLRLVKSDD